MHVTLAQYNRLPPELKAQVTSIDASIVEDAAPKAVCPIPDPADWDYQFTASLPNPEAAR